MSIMSYPVREAAKLAAHAYAAEKSTYLRPLIKDVLDGEVKAYLLKNDYLLIAGSNSIRDYLQFNMRVFNVGGRKFDLRSTATTRMPDGADWHQGFLAYAHEIQEWLGDRRPRMIFGHSLGGAATQILSRRYKVTGIAFASPRVVRGLPEKRNYPYCLNVCRNDDPVCAWPKTFSRIGKTIEVAPSRGSLRLNHSMSRYFAVLTKSKASAAIPFRFPTRT